MVFDFLAMYSWLPFAVCAIALFGGALTLLWHIRESGSARYVYVLFFSLILGGWGFILGGMQAGENPMIPRELTIPWIRLLWLMSGGIVLAFLILYWVRRVDWPDR